MDLGYFEFEQAPQKTLVGAADVDLRSLGAAPDLEHVGLDVLPDAVVLQRRLLCRGQNGLGLADIEDHGPRLDTGDRAGDQFPFTAGVLVENDVPLCLVKPLQDYLLGCLSVDPAEGLLVELLGLHEIADFGVGLDGLRLRDGQLRGRILDLIDDKPRSEDANLAGLGIDTDVDVFIARGSAVRGLDRLLDGPNQLLPRYALLGVQLQEGADEISTHFAPPVRLWTFVRSTRTPVRHLPLNKRRGGHPRHERPVDCRKYTRPLLGIQAAPGRCETATSR